MREGGSEPFIHPSELLRAGELGAARTTAVPVSPESVINVPPAYVRRRYRGRIARVHRALFRRRKRGEGRIGAAVRSAGSDRLPLRRRLPPLLLVLRAARPFALLSSARSRASLLFRERPFAHPGATSGVQTVKIDARSDAMHGPRPHPFSVPAALCNPPHVLPRGQPLCRHQCIFSHTQRIENSHPSPLRPPRYHYYDIPYVCGYVHGSSA